jgi:hypothetical protein
MEPAYQQQSALPATINSPGKASLSLGKRQVLSTVTLHGGIVNLSTATMQLQSTYLQQKATTSPTTSTIWTQPAYQQQQTGHS